MNPPLRYNTVMIQYDRLLSGRIICLRICCIAWCFLWISVPVLSLRPDEALPDAGVRGEVNQLRTIVDEDPGKVLERAPELLAELASTPMPDVELVLRALITDAYHSVGESRAALEAAQEWERAALRHQDRISQAHALNRQGICHWELGDGAASLSAYREALALLENRPDRDLELDILNNLGVLYSEMGDLQTALDYLLQVQDESDPERNPVAYADTLNSIGVLYREAGLLDDARENFNQALNLHIENGNRRGEADARKNLGILYQQEGRPDLALQFYEESVRLEQEMGNVMGLADRLSNMAEANIQLGNVIDATNQFERALSIYTDVDDQLRLTDVETKLARLYRQEGQLQRALDLGESALKRSAGLDDRSLQLRVLAELAATRAAMGDFQEAYRFQSEYMNLAGRVQVERAGQRATEMEARLELREKDREITLLQDQQDVQRRLIQVVIAALALVLGMLGLAVFAYRAKARTNRVIREVNRELVATRDELHRLSTIDPLTGLENRRSMSDRLKLERSRYERHARPLTMILGDIDYFKQINDQFGHSCGDDVLEEIGSIMKRSLREQDGVARWGGEEFLILLPETDGEGGRIVAEKIRSAVQEKPWKRSGKTVPVTITFGVATYRGGEIDDVLVRADDALYAGKGSGRNCVVVAEEAQEPTDLAANHTAEGS